MDTADQAYPAFVCGVWQIQFRSKWGDPNRVELVHYQVWSGARIGRETSRGRGVRCYHIFFIHLKLTCALYVVMWYSIHRGRSKYSLGRRLVLSLLMRWPPHYRQWWHISLIRLARLPLPHSCQTCCMRVGEIRVLLISIYVLNIC